MYFFDTINKKDLIIAYTRFKRWSVGELMIWDFRNWKCLYKFSDYCKNSKFAECKDIYPNDSCLFNVDNKNYIIICFCLIDNNKKETGYIYAFDFGGNKIKEIVPGKSGEISISKYYDKILMKNFIIIYNGSLASYDFNQKKFYKKEYVKSVQYEYKNIINLERKILLIGFNHYSPTVRIQNFHANEILTEYNNFFENRLIDMIQLMELIFIHGNII